MQHIRACLPELRTRVNSLLSKNQQVLTSLGGPVENKVRVVDYDLDPHVDHARAQHCCRSSFHSLLHTHKPSMVHLGTLKLAECKCCM